MELNVIWFNTNTTGFTWLYFISLKYFLILKTQDFIFKSYDIETHEKLYNGLIPYQFSLKLLLTETYWEFVHLEIDKLE